MEIKTLCVILCCVIAAVCIRDTGASTSDNPPPPLTYEQRLGQEFLERYQRLRGRLVAEEERKKRNGDKVLLLAGKIYLLEMEDEDKVDIKNKLDEYTKKECKIEDTVQAGVAIDPSTVGGNVDKLPLEWFFGLLEVQEFKCGEETIYVRERLNYPYENDEDTYFYLFKLNTNVYIPDYHKEYRERIKLVSVYDQIKVKLTHQHIFEVPEESEEFEPEILEESSVSDND